jgi:eukaryotic-like serine/threonine-protein kinase
MPMSSTTEHLLESIRQSALIEPRRLNAFLDRYKKNGPPADPAELTAAMVREGLLSPFHAERLLQGKNRCGFTIGKYRVLEKLGTGSMGTVYLCEHPGMKRLVAVKVLAANLADNPAALQRFHREAKAMAVIDHPNLVQAHDVDEDGFRHFLVMDYVDGISLQDLVTRFGPLPPLRAAHYIRQSARGLQHAHEQGLVHRDVKPGNLLVDRQGTVRMLDLGLARFFHDHEDILTLQYHEKIFLGTVDYAAPEQLLDSHNVDIRADVYSLGATFYFLLAGHPIFPGGKKSEKVLWHQTRPPKPILEIRPDVPPALAAVIHRMLAKQPQQRYQKPADVVAALAPWTQAPIPPPSEKELPPRHFVQRNGVVAEVQGESAPGPKVAATATTAPRSQSKRPGHTAPARPAAAPHVFPGSRRAAAAAGKEPVGKAVLPDTPIPPRSPRPSAARRPASALPAPAKPVRRHRQRFRWVGTLLIILLTAVIAGGAGAGSVWLLKSQPTAATPTSSKPASSRDSRP